MKTICFQKLLLTFFVQNVEFAVGVSQSTCLQFALPGAHGSSCKHLKTMGHSSGNGANYWLRGQGQSIKVSVCRTLIKFYLNIIRGYCIYGTYQVPGKTDYHYFSFHLTRGLAK